VHVNQFLNVLLYVMCRGHPGQYVNYNYITAIKVIMVIIIIIVIIIVIIISSFSK